MDAARMNDDFGVFLDTIFGTTSKMPRRNDVLDKLKPTKFYEDLSTLLATIKILGQGELIYTTTNINYVIQYIGQPPYIDYHDFDIVDLLYTMHRQYTLMDFIHLTKLLVISSRKSRFMPKHYKIKASDITFTEIESIDLHTPEANDYEYHFNTETIYIYINSEGYMKPRIIGKLYQVDVGTPIPFDNPYRSITIDVAIDYKSMPNIDLEYTEYRNY